MADGRLHIVKKTPTDNRRRIGALPPPLRMLRDRADRHFTTRLKAVFEQVDDTFFDLADRADNNRQQTHYFDAMRLIRFERKTIESAFQQSIALAFESLVSDAAAESRSSAHLNSAAFELADGEELEEIIALDAMVSRADEGNRQQLQYLAIRLESLISHAVALKDNPLGPDTVCDAFFRASEGLDIGIRSKLVLLKLFERHVVASLGDFLRHSNQLLQELGVLPKLGTSQGAETQPIRSKPQANSRHPGDFLDRDSLQHQQKNYGRLVGQLSSVMSRQRPGESATTAKLPTAVLADVIKGLGELPADSSLSLLERLQNQLVNRTEPAMLGETEQGLIHLVDALFDQICADTSFPPMLQPQLAGLQVAIAKAALNDHGFFDKQRHPARRLFNEAVQAAQGFDSAEQLDDDTLYDHVQAALQQLQQSACSPARLTQSLTELVSVTEKQRRRTVAKEQHLLEDEQASSQLDYSYTVVTLLLEEHLVGKKLPKVVVSFAEQAWSKVLFLSHLREGGESPSWQEAKDILERLSTQSLFGEHSAAQQVTDVMGVIRKKLAEIALDPYQTEHLINNLEKLLKAISNGSLPESTLADCEMVDVEQIYPSIPGDKKTAASSVAALFDQQELGNIEESYLHDIESITSGSWVEFSQPNGTIRVRYIGTVGPLNKLIFVNREGLKVVEGNSREMALALKQGILSILDNSPLFDRALAAVVDNMRHTS